MKRFLICSGTILGFMFLVKSFNILSFKFGYLIYPLFKSMDPDNVFMVLTIHHITQAFLSFLIIYIVTKVFKISLKEYGFNMNQLRFNLKAVLFFSAMWTGIQVISGIIIVKIMNTPSGFRIVGLMFAL